MRRRLPLFIGVALALVICIVGAVVLRQSKGTNSASNGPVSTINCVGGSEKSELMNDQGVKDILRKKYNLEVKFSSMGSYEQAQLKDEDIKSRALDCLWPSSVSAQYVFEQAHKTSAYSGYRAETVLQSPEVIYAGPQGTDALVKAGIVQQRSNQYFIVDMKRLLNDFVLKGQTWNSLGTTDLAGPIVVASTDPAKSNSGFTLYQLMLNIVASSDVYRAPSATEAHVALPQIRHLYDAQGLQARSSDSGFDQWLLQGGELHAPLYAGYENQIIQKVVQYQGNKQVSDELQNNIRILYPDPTVYSDHPILALDANAGKFIDAIKDPDIQALAWKKYGFRSGVQVGLSNVADFGQLPLAPSLRTTSPPNAEVTGLLLGCIRDNACN